jgi:hypothetical protein
LGLAVADRAPNDLGNLIMFVTFDVVKNKNRPVARGEVVDRSLQLEPVDGPGEGDIFRPEILPLGIFLTATLGGFFQRNHGKILFPQVHQHYVYREPMQPRRERRFAAKRRNLTIELEEGFLSQILRLSRIRRHTQAKRVHTPLMLIVEGLERSGIPLLSLLDEPGFGCIAGLSLRWVGQVAFSGRTP